MKFWKRSRKGPFSKLPDPFDRVQIEWDDAFSVDGWMTFGGLAAEPDRTITTVGVFVARLDGVFPKWIVSSAVVSVDGECSGGCTWFLPEAMIRSWVELS